MLSLLRRHFSPLIVVQGLALLLAKPPMSLQQRWVDQLCGGSGMHHQCMACPALLVLMIWCGNSDL